MYVFVDVTHVEHKCVHLSVHFLNGCGFSHSAIALSSQMNKAFRSGL